MQSMVYYLINQGDRWQVLIALLLVQLIDFHS